MSTSQTKPVHPGARALPLPYKELIVLIALLMSMTAMSIDIMLPSLPEIAATYGVTSQNDQQLEQMKQQFEAQLAQQKIAAEQQMAKYKADLDAATKVMVAKRNSQRLAISVIFSFSALCTRARKGSSGAAINSTIQDSAPNNNTTLALFT